MPDTSRSKRQRTIGPVLSLALVLAFPVGSEEDDRIRYFDIPSQPMESALLDFSEQARVQVLAATDLTESRKSKAVVGRYRPAQALTLLLDSPSLTVRVAAARTVAVAVREPDGSARRTSAPSRAQSEADITIGTDR